MWITLHVPTTTLTNNVDGEGSSFARKSPPPVDRVGAVVERDTFSVAGQIISLGIANAVSMNLLAARCSENKLLF